MHFNHVLPTNPVDSCSKWEINKYSYRQLQKKKKKPSSCCRSILTRVCVVCVRERACVPMCILSILILRDISNFQYYLGQIGWIVCTLGRRKRVCLPLFPYELLLSFQLRGTLTNERTVYLHVTCINNFGPFRNFAVWMRTAPTIKRNIVIILIPMSEQSNRSTGVNNMIF